MRDIVRRLSYVNKIYFINLIISVCNLYICIIKDLGIEGRII